VVGGWWLVVGGWWLQAVAGGVKRIIKTISTTGWAWKSQSYLWCRMYNKQVTSLFLTNKKTYKTMT
jgi:hypothetical protein